MKIAITANLDQFVYLQVIMFYQQTRYTELHSNCPEYTYNIGVYTLAQATKFFRFHIGIFRNIFFIRLP